ncbi:TIGR02444 family protein [Amphritea atlantica]|uniref:TIGR02444 family protein n=1 Tax=Amphritea atlantica TaxID=355243 RepID=A0A1H9M7H6_9GAMM|nr:TIGR02444 family protein [Amphritea atlantica]SER19083.1 TIGR02444 family protein [Amphritea atlantica]
MSENNAFWNYAVAIYSDPAIEQLCLRLQNRYQLSVNDLLFALWLAHLGRQLPETLDYAGVREWRINMLEPLRLLRYQLRQSKRSSAEEECYQRLKKAELAAERVESGLLYDLRDRCPDVSGTAGDMNQLGYVNLCTAAGTDPVMTGDLQAHFQQLVEKAIGCGGN